MSGLFSEESPRLDSNGQPLVPRTFNNKVSEKAVASGKTTQMPLSVIGAAPGFEPLHKKTEKMRYNIGIMVKSRFGIFNFRGIISMDPHIYAWWVVTNEAYERVVVGKKKLSLTVGRILPQHFGSEYARYSPGNCVVRNEHTASLSYHSRRNAHVQLLL